MSDPTIEAYESGGAGWAARRTPSRTEDPDPAGFATAATLVDGPVVDLGCGHGPDLGVLPPRAIGLDASDTMLALARAAHPDAPLVRADLGALPFGRHTLAGAWANRSYVHLPRTAMPLALWELHHVLRPGGVAHLVLFEGDEEHAPYADDTLRGRRFSLWPRDLLAAVLEGAGFEEVRIDEVDGTDHLVVRMRRGRTLADTVAPGMRLLLVGLNPSLYAADAGVGFARPGNRFWPAMAAAGLCGEETLRNPRLLLERHGIGMTDLVKRATVAATELSRDEFRRGATRLERLIAWLQPNAVCVVGITGWRAAVDASAEIGWQPRPLGGRPVYVMHNPSGLNAHATVDSLAAGLREVTR